VFAWHRASDVTQNTRRQYHRMIMSEMSSLSVRSYFMSSTCCGMNDHALQLMWLEVCFQAVGTKEIGTL